MILSSCNCSLFRLIDFHFTEYIIRYCYRLVHTCRKDRGFSPSDVCETVPYKTKYGANISSFANVYIHIKHSLNYICQKTLSPIFTISVNQAYRIYLLSRLPDYCIFEAKLLTMLIVFLCICLLFSLFSWRH